MSTAVKNMLDMVRNEICWMIERESTTTYDAAEKAGLPKARVDRFLRSETDDFTFEEAFLLLDAHNWAASFSSASRESLASIEWLSGDQDAVPRPIPAVEDPAPGLASDALPE